MRTMPNNDAVTVYFSTDHAGWSLRKPILRFLERAGYTVIDYGPDSKQAGDDYPIVAKNMLTAFKKAYAKNPTVRGVLVCGSGVGMAIAANRFPTVRAVEGYGAQQVKLAREHNNANVLTLGGRDIDSKLALRLLKIFLETPFSTSERHARRVQQIDQLP